MKDRRVGVLGVLHFSHAGVAGVEGASLHCLLATRTAPAAAPVRGVLAAAGESIALTKCHEGGSLQFEL